MITFKPVVFAHRKRKDGTFPVSIRVTFARKSRYIPTTITARAADLTRGMRIKNPTIIAQTNDLCDRLRAEAARLSPFALEGRDVDWVVARLSEGLRQQDFRLDFFTWADTFLLSKSESTRKKYATALNAFARFLGARAIDINDITHALLVAFAEDADAGSKRAYSRLRGGIVDTGKVRRAAISPYYLTHLSHVFDAAKDKYNDEDGGAVVIPRSPFRKLNMTPPVPRGGQRPLPVEVLQAMIDDGGCTPSVRRSLDVFLVGFALMGANIADLWEARPPKGPSWAYNRHKTRERRPDGAFILCEIPPEIRPLLARLGAGSSREWWLPVLHALGKDAGIAGQSVNRGLRSWCEARGFAPFTFYAGRHSFATLARRCGIEKATVDEALGHVGDFPLADIYAERDWSKAAEANRRVVGLFRWPCV